MLRFLASPFERPASLARGLRGLAVVTASTCALAGSAGAGNGTGPAAFDISHAVTAGGGGTSSGSDFVLDGSIGQVVAGAMQGGDFAISSGYLGTEGAYCERSDMNCDGIIDGADLGILLMNWGDCPGAAGCQGDINVDGFIDGADLGILLVHWG